MREDLPLSLFGMQPDGRQGPGNQTPRPVRASLAPTASGQRTPPPATYGMSDQPLEREQSDSLAPGISAGTRPYPLVTAEAVASAAASYLMRKGVASEDGAVPIQSFKDDLHRKLHLRRAMAPADQWTRAGGAAPGTQPPSREQADDDAPVEPDAQSPFTDMGDTFTKEEVNYRYSGRDGFQCGDCRYFDESGSCQIVAGLIRPVDVCDKFEPATTEGSMYGDDLFGDDSAPDDCEDYEKDDQGRCPSDPLYMSGEPLDDGSDDFFDGAYAAEVGRREADNGRVPPMDRSTPGRYGSTQDQPSPNLAKGGLPLRDRMGRATGPDGLGTYSGRGVRVVQAEAVRDPAALAAWIGRKKYGKDAFQRAAAQGKSLGEDEGYMGFDALTRSLAQRKEDEVSPPEWKGTVKAMQKHPEIVNPWALSWWMKKRGDQPHKEIDAYMGPLTVGDAPPSSASSMVRDPSAYSSLPQEVSGPEQQRRGISGVRMGDGWPVVQAEMAEG